MHVAPTRSSCVRHVPRRADRERERGVRRRRVRAARAGRPPTKSTPPTQSGGVTGTPARTTTASALPRPAEPPVVPAARKRAKDLDVDLARHRQRSNGRVTVEDVGPCRAAALRIEVALGGRGVDQGPRAVRWVGFGTDVSAFSPQVGALSAAFLVRGVNPRGVGFSSAPAAESYDVATAAADVAALANGPAHVVGASLGAAVALELAIARPACARSC
jgi:hypothetical protein